MAIGINLRCCKTNHSFLVFRLCILQKSLSTGHYFPKYRKFIIDFLETSGLALLPFHTKSFSKNFIISGNPIT